MQRCIDVVQRCFDVVSTLGTDVVSTLCNVENPRSDFVSFSMSIHNVDPQRWNNIDPTLKCWLGQYSMGKLVQSKQKTLCIPFCGRHSLKWRPLYCVMHGANCKSRRINILVFYTWPLNAVIKVVYELIFEVDSAIFNDHTRKL